jgi:Protein of unknown function (DUF3108)
VIGPRSALRALAPGALLLATAATAVAAQTGSAAPEIHPPAGDAHAFASRWPFSVGERAEYDVTFGPVRVGRASLEVEDSQDIRGEPAYRLAFELEGGPVFYKIDDRTVSWLAPDPYRSLRFEQVLREGGYRRHRRYELDQEAGTFDRQDWDEESASYLTDETERAVDMPALSLDEVAFLYLVRTLPLEVGRTYTFHNYFEEDANPVIVEVLRRESVRLKSGRYETVVVRPIIKAGGMFGEDGQAEVFVADDASRAIVQMKVRMKVGAVNMYLREYEAGAG